MPPKKPESRAASDEARAPESAKKLPPLRVGVARRRELEAMAAAAGERTLTAWMAKAIDAYASDGPGAGLPSDAEFTARLKLILSEYGLSTDDQLAAVRIAVKYLAELIEAGHRPIIGGTVAHRGKVKTKR